MVFFWFLLEDKMTKDPWLFWRGGFHERQVLRIGSLSILNKPLPILPIRSYRFVMLPFNFTLIMTGPTDTPIFPRKSRIDIYMLSRKFQLIDHASIHPVHFDSFPHKAKRREIILFVHVLVCLWHELDAL